LGLSGLAGRITDRKRVLAISQWRNPSYIMVQGH
jgi:hypothetical protein